MTIFGILWILFLLMLFIKQDLEKIIFMLLLSSIFQCNNVLIFNGIGIGPFIITSIFLLIYYIFFLKKPKSQLKFESLPMSIIMILFSIILSTFMNNVLSSNFLTIFQIFIYILCFLIIRRIFEYRKYDYKKMIKKIIDIVLIIGAIQYLCSLGIIPKNVIFQTFLYNDYNNINIAYYVTTKARIYSTFLEPSYCAAFLLYSFCISIMYFNGKKYNTVRILVILIEIALTFSTTAYVGIILCCIIIFIFTNNKTKLFKLIPFFIIGILILFGLGYLDSVIFTKGTSMSALTRNIWNKIALNNFLLSPIYGVGYKMSRASSLYYQLLGELGLLGIISYVIFIIIIIKNLFIKKQNTQKGIVTALLSVILCQLIAIPDLDFCVFWYALYIYGMFFHHNFKYT